jgi:hypothetical protein
MLNQAPQGAPAPEAPIVQAPEAAPVTRSVEAVPDAEKVEPKEDPKFAARFAALTRKEQAIRAQEAEVKEWKNKYRAYEEEERLAKDNPLKWLEKRGLSYDKLTQLALNDGAKPAEMQVQELREQLEREKQEREERETERAKKDVEYKTQEFLSGVDEFLTANSDTYELLRNHEDGPGLVLEVMNVHKQKHGRVLSVTEAAEFIEKHFEGELETKYGKIKKIRNKFGTPPADPAPPVVPAAPALRTQSPTLTNNQAASVATPSTQKVLSLEESKREAAKILKWV